jgi:GT2 family glycosyltransferase
MKIQIVMPAINIWSKYSRPAIESVNEAMMRAKVHGIDCRLLFIDNASTDETKVEAEKMVSELFAYQRNEERWGFQKSVNFGVNDGFERGYDVVLIVNNDIILHPEAIWRLAERFEKGGAGMVSCMDVRGEMTENGIVPRDIGRLLSQDKEVVEEAPNPHFSAFVVDKVCWDTVGEFDELFAPAYFEDNDFHYRMKLTGLLAVTYPPAMFYHFGSRTQNEAQENGLPIVPTPAFENNRAFYARKWGGVPGSEKWEHPYNDPLVPITRVKQTPV